MTGLEVLVAALRSDPARVAVEHRGRAITAGDFLGQAQALAVLLRSAGLEEGEVMGVAAADNVTAMQLVLASWMCGAAALVLDLRLSARGLAEWRGRTGMRLLAGPRRPLPGHGPQVVPIPARPAPLDRLPWDLPAKGDLVADHFVSSGTTGFPKVKPVTQEGLATRIDGWLNGPDRDDFGTAVSALSVAYPASRATWYRKLAAGRTLIALDLLHAPKELDAALLRPDVEECSLPPVLVRRLLQLPDRGPGPRYPHLRRLNAVGGPASARDQLDAARRLTPNYGMTYSSTECGLVTRITGAEILARPASCGRPVAGVRVEIWEGDRLCGPGETGTIRVRREGFDPIEPGDLGWLDEEGYLYIAGRSGGMMCRNGINVSVAQVEQALLACELVEDAVVWPTPDEDGGDRIHAAVECPAEAEAAVAEFIRRALSHQERPDRVLFARRLPRGPGGKPDRRAIVAQATEELSDA